MAALTQDRNTPATGESVFTDPVKAGVTIFAGALTCLDADGNLVPGAEATTLMARGRAKAKVVGGAADGDITADSETGIFRFSNSAAADAITRADIGENCFVVDDQTVAKTNGAGTRSVAGRIVQLDAQGVWVRVGR